MFCTHSVQDYAKVLEKIGGGPRNRPSICSRDHFCRIGSTVPTSGGKGRLNRNREQPSSVRRYWRWVCRHHSRPRFLYREFTHGRLQPLAHRGQRVAHGHLPSVDQIIGALEVVIGKP